MNHEQRIKNLEKQVSNLEKVLSASGLLEDFVPVSMAAKRLNIKVWTIRKRIRDDKNLIPGKHYIMNGKRYKINISLWQKLMVADAKAKQNQNASH